MATKTKPKARKNRRMLSAIMEVGTLRQVAARVGVNPSTLSAWVNRHNSPNAAKLAKLAEVTGKSIDYLLGG